MYSEIARWNISDGRCLGVNAKGFLGVPRQLKIFNQVRSNNKKKSVSFCPKKRFRN